MSRWQTLKKVLTDRDYRTVRLAKAGFYNNMPDREYIEMVYQARLHRPLNLENPQLFNEKLQWLKLNVHNPLYTQLVDKYRVREYITGKIGEEYLIPLLGVWDDPGEIDFDTLPDQFVLKCNHNSGTGMCICRDKTNLDRNKVRRNLKKGLRQNFFLKAREWPYKDVPRCIVCEKYLSDPNGNGDLMEYKFSCFNGKVKFFAVHFGMFAEHHANFYDREGHFIPYGEAEQPPSVDKQIVFPRSLPKMIELAEKLAGDIPFLRVDLYCVDEKIYFSEVTFYQDGGWGLSTDERWDVIKGNWLSLPFE